jgi:hypothetical protein
LSKITAKKKKVFFFTFFGLLRFSVFFNGLFAPTSQSGMSNIFIDLESLGKSAGNKWPQTGKLLLIKSVKLPQI